MPRGLTAGMLTEVAATLKRPRWFADLEFTSGHLYVWTGFQPITWDGHTWAPVGNAGGLGPIRNGSEVRADGITLSLSGISSDYLALALGDVRQGKAAKVYLGMVDTAGAIVTDPVLIFSGHMDVPTIEETGETAVITISAESRIARIRPHEDIISRMLTSCAGTLMWAEGKWHIHAGAHTASVQTITEDDLAGPVRVTSRLARSELVNRVKGTYASPGNKHLPTDYPALKNSTYVTEDGEVFVLDHDLPFTNSSPTAQRLAKIELEAARQQITVALVCKLTCLQIRPPDRVALTIARFGWSAKLFRCIEAVIDAEGDALVVKLLLRETAAAVYDWSAEETLVDPAPDTDLPLPYLPQPVPEQSGLAKDGDTVTFPIPYNSIPEVNVIRHTALSFYYTGSAPWNSAANQQTKFLATSITTTGCSIVAKVQTQASGFTAKTASFAAATADDVGEVVQCDKGDADEAIDDVYTYQFDVTVATGYRMEGDPEPSTIELAFESRPTNSGSWNTHGVASYENISFTSTATYSNQRKAYTINGLNSTVSQFRIRIVSEFKVGSSIVGDHVEWNEATGAPVEVSATPNADNYVKWIAAREAE